MMSKADTNGRGVAVLVRGFPNIVQTYIINHLTALIDAGYDVGIVAVFDPQQREVHPAVDSYNMIDRTTYINTDRSKLLSQIMKLPVFKPRYLSALLRIIFSRLWFKYGPVYTIKAFLKARSVSGKNIELAHSHALVSSYEYLFLKDVFDIPVVTTFHGLEPKSAQPMSNSKIRQVLTDCDAFFLNTDFARQQLIGLGCDKNKIHIIPQSTNIDDFPFTARSIEKDEPINILSVGRLSIEKGFHIAIDAIARLKDKHPDIHYNIIGSGVEENNLQQQIDSLGLQQHVSIIGGVSTEILQQQYASASLFILPSIDFRDGSHTETQGVVLQEAQASGIPVIASRTGGIPEIIKHGETGLLFDEESSQQLSDAIDSLISDDPLYAKLQRQGRKDVEDNYNVDVICKRITSVYDSVRSSHG